MIEIDANKDLSQLVSKFEECEDLILKRSSNTDNQVLELESLQWDADEGEQEFKLIGFIFYFLNMCSKHSDDEKVLS